MPSHLTRVQGTDVSTDIHSRRAMINPYTDVHVALHWKPSNGLRDPESNSQ